MPRRQGRDWDDFYPVSTPRPVADGLGLKVKNANTRGGIGATWWSKRWLGILESFGMGSRLTRGRSYARQGQVISLEVTPGLVKAKVQGSRPRPYLVKIELKPLTNAQWAKVIEALSTQALFAAKLLGGEMPTTIEEAFGAAGVALFPRSEAELETDCNCPDFANPCKHIAAVYYVMADRFDENPFLLFQLRGQTQAELISALREKRTAAGAGSVEGGLPTAGTELETQVAIGASGEKQTASPVTGLNALEKLNQLLAGAEITGDEAEETELQSLEFSLENFWEFNSDSSSDAGVDGELAGLTYNLTSPLVETALLKRLGKSPFKTGKTDVTNILEIAYLRARLIAQQKKEF